MESKKVIIRVILREAKRRRISDKNPVKILHSYLVQNDSFDTFYDSIVSDILFFDELSGLICANQTCYHFDMRRMRKGVNGLDFVYRIVALFDQHFYIANLC